MKMVVAIIVILGLLFTKQVRAETYVFDRVVPAGARLVYEEGGKVVREMNAPEGRVHIIVTTGSDVSIRPMHRRKR